MFRVAEALGSDEVVVYGSVEYLIQDIRHLLRSVYDQIDENNATLGHLIPTQVVQGGKAVLHPVPDGHLDRTDTWIAGCTSRSRGAS